MVSLSVIVLLCYTSGTHRLLSPIRASQANAGLSCAVGKPLQVCCSVHTPLETASGSLNGVLLVWSVSAVHIVMRVLNVLPYIVWNKTTKPWFRNGHVMRCQGVSSVVWVQDSRPALVQGALECLTGVCELAGAQFMRRRLQTEAWPVLLQLMKQGILDHTHLPYPAGASTCTQSQISDVNSRLVMVRRSNQSGTGRPLTARALPVDCYASLLTMYRTPSLPLQSGDLQSLGQDACIIQRQCMLVELTTCQLL